MMSSSNLTKSGVTHSRRHKTNVFFFIVFFPHSFGLAYVDMVYIECIVSVRT